MRRWLRRLAALAVGWRLLGPATPTPDFGPGQRHPWRLPGRTVLTGDREFLVREAGPPDAPPVVLIHGLGGSSLAEWYEVGPQLADRFRLIVIDHRSHGLSPRQTERFEVADLADDVAGVLDALDVGAVDAVGYSMGGAITQELARRYPARVRRMALIGSLTHHPPAWRVARTVGVWLTRAWERLTGVGTPEVRAGYLIATGAVRREHARWMWDETHRRDPDAGAQASFALLRFDSRDWVGRLRQPALVVIPGRDQLVPPAWQYRLAAELGDARVLELADGRHEVPWTHGDRIAQALTEFFSEEEP